jgi:autotransporter-associated beta strand protein
VRTILSDSSNLTITGGTFDISTYSDTVNIITMTNGNLTGTTGVLTGSAYNITGGTVTANLGGGTLYIGNGTTSISVIGSNVALNVNGGSAVAALTNNVTAMSVTLLNGGSITGAYSLNSTGGLGASSGTVASNLIGSGGVTMNGTGNTLTLTGSNTYTGNTTITSGTISVNAAAAVAGTSGINLANGTTFLYTGSTGSIDRAISVTSGTGTLRNTGGGVLTLGGTLSKNGTTLTFGGGSFNVTGSIVGSAPNSDLVVDTATVTLNGANTYNGPTFIRNGSSLTANRDQRSADGERTHGRDDG